MRNQSFLRSFVWLAVAGTVALVLPACGGGGGGGSAGSDDNKDLYLQSFLIVDQFGNQLGGQQSTNVYRNARLLFTFNVPIDFSTVTDRTVRVGIPVTLQDGSQLLQEALGRYETVPGNPNQIIFNPTSTTAQDVEDNPFGFDANGFYSVLIPSVLDQNLAVTNADGKGVVQTFTTTFTTGVEYVQDYEEPQFLSSNPTEGEVDVDSRSDIDMTFSKPMRPDSFILGQTITVVNADNGRQVVGTIRSSPDAKTISYRPLIGYGPGPSPIVVTVSRSVVSFSGNPLPKDIRLTFTTVFDPGQPNVDEVIEEFSTNLYEEVDPTVYTPVNPVADWNKGATIGSLAGLAGSGQITVQKSIGTFLYPPWGWGSGSSGLIFQTYHDNTELGASARTIAGYDWWVDSTNAASTATNVSLFAGEADRANLTTNFPTNWTFGGNQFTPTTVVNNLASYLIPQGGRRWLAAPTWSTNFLYMGNANMQIEIRCTGGMPGPYGTPAVTYAGAWGVNTSDPNSRTAFNYPAVLGNTVVTSRYNVDIRWNWLITTSEAQSKWYDIGATDPSFLDVLFAPSIADQPAGTTSTWTFQGAPESASNPGNPDLVNASNWRNDLPSLSGNRFVRFRVVMGGNITTGQAPTYDRLVFPFIYFQ